MGGANATCSEDKVGSGPIGKRNPAPRIVMFCGTGHLGEKYHRLASAGHDLARPRHSARRISDPAGTAVVHALPCPFGGQRIEQNIETESQGNIQDVGENRISFSRHSLVQADAKTVYRRPNLTHVRRPKSTRLFPPSFPGCVFSAETSGRVLDGGKRTTGASGFGGRGSVSTLVTQPLPRLVACQDSPCGLRQGQGRAVSQSLPTRNFPAS